MCASIPTSAIWNGLGEMVCSAYRRAGVSIEKSVLSKMGVVEGRRSSAQRGPRREADWVVAKVGIESMVPEGPDEKGAGCLAQVDFGWRGRVKVRVNDRGTDWLLSFFARWR